MNQAQLDQLKDSIAKADKVLVGIGNEMDVTFPEDCRDFTDYGQSLKAKEWLAAQKEIRQDKAYQNLKKLLEGKDYYIITLGMEDAIFRTFDGEANITTPCGGLHQLQCANGCSDDLVPFEEGKDSYICEKCGRPMIFNNVYAYDNYIEKGYLDKFAEYKKWLQTTINKNLCIVELGVGLRYPSVIRFAFDKLAYYNQKAEFYRINEKLYQHTAENHGKGISIAENSLDVLTSLFE